jgi:hypothetical protein
MGDLSSPDEDDMLRVQLDVHLDRQPVQGRLRTEAGSETGFVGWLDFVGALERLRDIESPPSARAHDEPS